MALVNSFIFSSNPRRWVAAFFLSGIFLSLGILASTEWLIRVHINPIDANLQHRDFFLKAPCLDAIFGNSRPVFAITVPGRFVNLAHWGENTEIFRYKIKQFLSRCSPKRVILQADPHLFSSERENQNLDFELALYRPPPLFYIFEQRHYRAIINYWLRFIATRGAMKSGFIQREDGSFIRMDRFIDHSPLERTAMVQRGIATRIPLPISTILESKTYAAFKEAVQILRTRKIDLCLVGMPVSLKYWRAEDNIPEFSLVRRMLRNLASRYGARYIDLRKWEGREDSYADEDHLNDNGARAFSTTILASCGW